MKKINKFKFEFRKKDLLKLKDLFDESFDGLFIGETVDVDKFEKLPVISNLMRLCFIDLLEVLQDEELITEENHE